MRLEDASDYVRLRRLVRNPAATLFFRKGQRAGRTLCVEMLDAPPLFLRGGHADFHMFHRVFLRDEYRLNPHPPGSLDCVIDLGANVGVFAARAGRLARRVLALEPSPTVYQQLQRNAEGLATVTPIQSAVGGKEGTLRLYRPLDGATSGASSAVEGRAGMVSEAYDEVPATTLDALFRDHGVESCDLLKIDIEGMEYETLHAASSETLSAIRRIHGEYHELPGDDRGSHIDGLEGLLQRHGFQMERVPHRRKKNHGLFFAVRPGRG